MFGIISFTPVAKINFFAKNRSSVAVLIPKPFSVFVLVNASPL